MKIAILIPVYNAEKYLCECLDSALAAGTELMRQGRLSFEIRCRDDGSRDGSAAILKEYAGRHSNVTFVSQTNAGVSATRNRLMDELPDDVDAFAFLDSDDTVQPCMYAALAEAMVRTGADVAETEWDGIETVLDDMSVFILRRTAPGRWINVINKLYRKSAVGSIRFRDGLCFEEDLFFNFEVHQAIRRKVLVPGHYYYYRPNPGSATSVLNLRRYFDSTTRRIRLSCEEFLNAGRIPSAPEPEFRRELVKDAYRMCLRKNLKKNKDAVLRRELFFAAGDFFRGLERDCGFCPDGLNPIQRLLYSCCRSGRYRFARCVACLT